MLKVTLKREWVDLNVNLAEHSAILEEVSEVILSIESGNLDVRFSDKLISTHVGQSLDAVVRRLKQSESEEKSRRWFNDGLAHFLDIFKNSRNIPLPEILDTVLSALIHFLNANQGAISLLEEEDNGDEYLEMRACYAYERKKHLHKKQFLTEGLAGQSIIEREFIYLRDVPKDYIRITSGLGHAIPTNVLIFPMMSNDDPVGVIELASFSNLDANKREFTKRIAENLASIIKSAKEREKLSRALALAEEKTDEISAKEEELRQNMEEMTCIQEQLARNEVELKKRLKKAEESLRVEQSSEIAKIREEEKLLLESKLEAQKNSYELILNRLKSKLQSTKTA